MTTAFEGGRQPELENFVSETGGDDAATHRQHVGVIVLPGEPGGIEVVAQRGAHAGNLVRGDLLALPAAAEDDAPIGAAFRHLASDREADRRIVNRRVAGGAVIGNRMPESRERLLQVLLEREARVICANRNSHDTRFYYTL